jgi:glutathione S-transferase
MSGIIVHSVPGSPFGRAVLATLVEKGVPFRLSTVAPGGLRAPAHLARHPFGRVPVLEQDGFLLYETQAILRHLDRAFPAPSLTPAGLHDAARMDQAMNVCDWYLFQGVGNVIGFQRVVGPRLLGLPTDEAAIAAAMPKAHAVYDELSRLLADRPYFAGDRLSLADLMLAPHVDFLVGLPEWQPLTEGNPNLVAWLARMNQRPGMQATTWERVAALAAA